MFVDINLDLRDEAIRYNGVLLAKVVEIKARELEVSVSSVLRKADLNQQLLIKWEKGTIPRESSLIALHKAFNKIKNGDF